MNVVSSVEMVTTQKKRQKDLTDRYNYNICDCCMRKTGNSILIWLIVHSSHLQLRSYF